MESNWRVTYFKPDRQGEFFGGTSVRFAASMLTEEECGVILYDKNGREQRFPFSPEGKRGALYGLEIEGGGLENYTYNFYMGKQVMTSPYAREIRGLEKWGECQGGKVGVGGWVGGGTPSYKQGERGWDKGLVGEGDNV